MALISKFVVDVFDVASPEGTSVKHTGRFTLWREAPIPGRSAHTTGPAPSFRSFAVLNDTILSRCSIVTNGSASMVLWPTGTTVTPATASQKAVWGQQRTIELFQLPLSCKTGQAKDTSKAACLGVAASYDSINNTIWNLSSDGEAVGFWENNGLAPRPTTEAQWGKTAQMVGSDAAPASSRSGIGSLPVLVPWNLTPPSECSGLEDYISKLHLETTSLPAPPTSFNTLFASAMGIVDLGPETPSGATVAILAATLSRLATHYLPPSTPELLPQLADTARVGYDAPEFE
ncbi:unnamed protein product, partial [Symbiodinium sp. KB8]